MTAAEPKLGFDIEKIRKDFPVLQRELGKYPLVYLDNGATTQKPMAVIEAIDHYYAYYNSNVHRGVHQLSQEATQAMEEARVKVQKHLNAKKEEEIIFTSGTTDAINLVAHCFGKKFVNRGDEILISTMEHHANIVPWQMLCEEKGARLKVIPINQEGDIILEEYYQLLNEKTKIVAIAHVSNTLGTINPVEEIITAAHKKNIPVLLDGAQALSHQAVDVQKLDCDFYAFSGHKIFGPTGIGVLYGKEKWLNEMPPYRGGGEMIASVSFEKTTYNVLPFKFEAGTPNIVGAIAMGVALDYINSIGLKNISQHEKELLHYATLELEKIEGLKIIGKAKKKASIISFNIADIHPYDVGMLLDKQGIAVRTGHHCTEPLMNFYTIPGTVRASMAFYNNIKDIDRLVEGLDKAVTMLKVKS